jgi:membrane protein implicated in regulation of membrane protease activity
MLLPIRRQQQVSSLLLLALAAAVGSERFQTRHQTPVQDEEVKKVRLFGAMAVVEHPKKKGRPKTLEEGAKDTRFNAFFAGVAPSEFF